MKTSSYLENKIFVFRELKGSGYTYFEVKLANPGGTFTATDFWLAYVKHGETNTEFYLEYPKTISDAWEYTILLKREKKSFSELEKKLL